MQAIQFDRSRPCLVFAPHLEYPLRNGADILIAKKWGAFSLYVPHVDIVGLRTVARYVKGKVASISAFENQDRGKLSASLRVLLCGGHYLRERFLTDSYIRRANLNLSAYSYGTVVYSYIFSTSLHETRRNYPVLTCVETHNDEFEWFTDIQRRTANPLAKIVAYRSRRWLYKHLREHGAAHLYLHVSDRDMRGYTDRLLCPKSLVIPVGVEPRALQTSDGPVHSRHIVLTFTGSLNVGTNSDALEHFAQRFFPGLKSDLGDSLTIRVAGSRPAQRVVKLCRRFGWELIANLDAAAMDKVMQDTTFALLPFAYSTGVKLKLLHALSYGVPVLATKAVDHQMGALPYPCVVSDDVEEWVTVVRKIASASVSSCERQKLWQLAHRSTWPVIAGKLVDALSVNS